MSTTKNFITTTKIHLSARLQHSVLTPSTVLSDTSMNSISSFDKVIADADFLLWQVQALQSNRLYPHFHASRVFFAPDATSESRWHLSSGRPMPGYCAGRLRELSGSAAATMASRILDAGRWNPSVLLRQRIHRHQKL